MNNQETATNKRHEDNAADEKHQLLFDAGRSMRYHDKRAAFFDFCDKFLTFLSLMFSSATLAALLGQNRITAGVAAVISSAVSALSLVGGFANKARSHFEFKKQWHDLYFTIEQAEPLPQNLRTLKSEYQRIEREEPAVMYWVNELCYIEQAKAMGYTREELEKQNIRPVHWIYRLTGQLHNFNSDPFK